MTLPPTLWHSHTMTLPHHVTPTHCDAPTHYDAPHKLRHPHTIWHSHPHALRHSHIHTLQHFYTLWNWCTYPYRTLKLSTSFFYFFFPLSLSLFFFFLWSFLSEKTDRPDARTTTQWKRTEKRENQLPAGVWTSHHQQQLKKQPLSCVKPKLRALMSPY